MKKYTAVRYKKWYILAEGLEEMAPFYEGHSRITVQVMIMIASNSCVRKGGKEKGEYGELRGEKEVVGKFKGR